MTANASGTVPSKARFGDLTIVAGLTLVAGAVVLSPTAPQPLVWVFGSALLVLCPGYAVVSVLFPETGRESDGSDGTHTGAGPGLVDRLALSVVISPVIVAAVGLALHVPEAIALRPIVIGLVSTTVLLVVVAHLRRRQLPPRHRARPLSGPTRPSVQSLFVGTPMQNLTVVLAVLLLAGALAFAVTEPPASDGFTESYLLTEDENGEFVADGYPTEIAVGEEASVYVGIENHENVATTYDVVVLVQDVGPNGTVTSQEQVDRFDVELRSGEQTLEEVTIDPSAPGEPRRVQALVYTESVPSVPTADSADQTLEFWTTVSG